MILVGIVVVPILCRSILMSDLRVNAVPFDADASSPLVNASEDGRAREDAIDTPWHRAMHAANVKAGTTARVFEATFGPPALVLPISGGTHVWTFDQDGVVVYALVSERGAYWEWPGGTRWTNAPAAADVDRAWGIVRSVQQRVLESRRRPAVR